MKKTLSAVALALVAVLLMGCLVACGGGKISDGTYKLVQMTADGKDISDQLSAMEQYGMSLDLVVSGDKATLMDQEMTIKDGKFTASDGSSAAFTVNGNKITVEEGNNKMVFEKK